MTNAPDAETSQGALITQSVWRRSMTDLTYHTAVRLLKPDFETGRLFWLPRTPDLFAVESDCAAWNRRYAGTEAFLTKHTKGYLTGKVGSRTYRAHRVVWLLAHKAWPEDQIDHINGIRTDNRLINLREATNSINMRNACLPRHNTSGTIGVAWSERDQRWRARMHLGNRSLSLGYFHEIEDAIAARKAAEKLYGFHENHGRG
jgi:hypothetical protein